MTNQFKVTRPSAIVTEKKNSNGDVIIYINGQTAFNKGDRYNSSNWTTMMENAYQRSLKNN